MFKPQKLNKKGEFENIVFLTVMIFTVAIIFLILGYAISQALPSLNEALTHSTPVESNKNVTKILDGAENAIYNFNLWFPFLIVGLITFIIVFAFYTESHPVFFFIGLVLLAISLIVGTVYSNVYQRISGTEEFAPTAANFNIMGLFMEYLPVIVFIAFIIISIIVYVVARDKGATGGL